MAVGVKRKKPPSVKQLRARAKFVKMVRARARAAKAAKRGTGKRRNVEQGYMAGGVFHPIRSSSDYSAKRAHEAVKKKARFATKGKKRNPRNGIFRSAARAAISRRLTKPIRFGRKRNQGTPVGIEQMHEKFLGRPTHGTHEIIAPQGTPHDVAVLGELTKLKTEDEEFLFEKGEAYMGADAKGNLYVLGDVQVEANTSFGAIEEIDYLARKDHINPARIRGSRRRKARRNPGTLVEYYHFFGEEGGSLPKLKTDGDGMMHITGGSYTIEAEGITN